MIEITNEQNKIEITEEINELIEKSIEFTMEYVKFDYDYEISVMFTDNESIRSINSEFRNIDKETDVLSFPMIEYEEPYFNSGKINNIDFNYDTGAVILGDMVLSLEKAKEQAVEYGHSFQREVAFLTVHSTLHLLGYDHIEENDRVLMRKKEEELLNGLKLYR